MTSATMTSKTLDTALAVGRIDTRIEVFLSFWDRVRVLFGGSVRIRVWTITENDPGRSESVSCVLGVGSYEDVAQDRTECSSAEST